MTARVSRRALTVGAVVAGLAAGAYLVFGGSDERRVRRVLEELAAASSTLPGDTEASRARRVEAAFAERTTESVRLSVPELGELEGRAAVVELLAGTGLIPLEFTIDAASVQIDGGGKRARAALTASAVLRYPGEERRDTRSVRVELTGGGGAFRVTSIRVDEKSRVEPEARP